MKKSVIWITGAGGLIGSHLVRLAPSMAPDFQVIALERQDLDLTDHDAVNRRFKRESPSVLIHCAAMSHSVQCEQQPDLARRINVEATARLTQLFAERRVVFFSTDLVFNGSKGNYIESDIPQPLGVYARTKVDAEQCVLADPKNLVVRTSLNGGPSPNRSRGFNEALQSAWREGRITRLFVDEFRCPIPASVTARATWELVLSNVQGIWHVAGLERLSRFEIGQRVAALHPELSPRIQPVSLKDVNAPVRAPDCSLNCEKAQAALSFPLPGLTDWLANNPEEPF